MDKQLLDNYTNAIRARPILKLLPTGLREHCLQYEQMCLADIRTQTNDPDLTESEALALAPSITSKVIKVLLPVLSELALTWVKKHWPAAATSGAVSAYLTYLATKYLGGM